jgi:hypothetical protein
MFSVSEPSTLEAVQSLQVDVDSLAVHVRDLCDRFGRKKRARRYRSPNREYAVRSPGASGRHTARRNNLGAQPVPSLRAHLEEIVDAPPHSNYTDFPPRRNASNRIFRPQKLEYGPYRIDRTVVPILRATAVPVPPG